MYPLVKNKQMLFKQMLNTKIIQSYKTLWDSNQLNKRLNMMSDDC